MIFNIYEICNITKHFDSYDWKKFVYHVKHLIIIISQMSFFKVMTISMQLIFW
jgi:hypothetical protein